MTKEYTYILKCADNSYYTGSTKNLDRRLAQHQNGEGAKHTAARLPVKLVYFEEYERIDKAFYREKQIQGWSRAKKEALINNQLDKLPGLSRNYTQASASASTSSADQAKSSAGKPTRADYKPTRTDNEPETTGKRPKIAGNQPNMEKQKPRSSKESSLPSNLERSRREPVERREGKDDSNPPNKL